MDGFDPALAAHVTDLVDAEVAGFAQDSQGARMTLEDFRKLRVQVVANTVNFSGGFRQVCYRVTRSNGDYSVFYLPTAACFSLCVDSDIGPHDIGVHGSALDCFASV